MVPKIDFMNKVRNKVKIMKEKKPSLKSFSYSVNPFTSLTFMRTNVMRMFQNRNLAIWIIFTFFHDYFLFFSIAFRSSLKPLVPQEMSSILAKA